MHGIAGDGEAGAGNVLLAQVRQRFLELAAPFRIAARDALGAWAGLPDTEQPDPVETLGSEAVKLRVRDLVQRGGPAQLLRQFRQPDTGIDLEERRITDSSHERLRVRCR